MKDETRSLLQRTITWLLRLIVGGVFIFSGFVKGIDPWGTLYKVEEYLQVMGLPVWPSITVAGVFILCGYEFLTGVFLALGSFRRSSPWMAALLMLVMTPLTLWIAIADPVADCGCFGDAWVLSNWATFWKNIFISAAIVWLIIYNRKSGWLVTPALQWIEFVVSALFIVFTGIVGYIAQPMLDFRGYPVGGPLVELDASSYDEPEYVFVYEKDGVQKKFSVDDELPDEDDGWTFVDREEIKNPVAEKSAAHSERNFRIWDSETHDDVTDDLIIPGERELLVLIPDMSRVSLSTAWVLNSLYEWAQKNDISMLAVVAGSDSDVSNWQDLAMPSYPIYRSDDTEIKEVARGNPALVYVQDNEIMWKNSLRAINVDDFLAKDTASDPMAFAPNHLRLLYQITGVYVSILAVLIALSFMQKLKIRPLRRQPTPSTAADNTTTDADIQKPTADN